MSTPRPSLEEARNAPLPWEVIALRYATLERRRIENFIFHDLHDGPAKMDYFVWLLRQGNHAVLVDTGFGEAQAKARNRTLLRCPVRSLSALGVEPEAIQDVVITHAHYDHAGNLDRVPNARFHLQEREMQYATGPAMRYKPLRHAYCVDDVCEMVRLVHSDRMDFHDGDYALGRGLTVHHVGGHTRGLQIVRVYTRRGWVVLASDAAHYLENLRNRSPFPIVADMQEMLAAYDLIESLADSPAHIVPGHDPSVLASYQVVGPEGLDAVSLVDPLPAV